MERWRKKESEIKFEAYNWKLLEGLRYVKPYSFDFVLESVGIYENTEIILKAVDILNKKMTMLIENLEKDEIDIHASDNTVENCYDVILENEDYTIGNILNYELYTIFYIDFKMLDYIGF